MNGVIGTVFRPSFVEIGPLGRTWPHNQHGNITRLFVSVGKENKPKNSISHYWALSNRTLLSALPEGSTVQRPGTCRSSCCILVHVLCRCKCSKCLLYAANCRGLLSCFGWLCFSLAATRDSRDTSSSGAELMLHTLSFSKVPLILC